MLVLVVPPRGDQGTAQAKPKRDPETAVVTGRAIDAASGRPIDGAVVTMTGRQDSWPMFFRTGRPPRISVMTRADGRFTFRNLMAGAFGIEVAKPGYINGAHGQRRPGGSSRAVVVEQAEQIDITIVLWRYAAITGIILDEVGEPVVGQEVRALRRVFAGGRYHLRGAGSRWTDDRGVYRIGALLPGTYIVMPAITQRAVAATAVESGLAPDGTAIVRVGSALHVIDVDSPVPPLLPGNDRLLIYPMQFYPGVQTAAQATPIVIGSGEERANVDFQFLPVPAARVSGRAFDALPGAHVTLRLFPVTSDTSDTPVAEAFSDANGLFMFPAVPPGDYVLKAISTTSEDNRWAVVGFSVGQRDIAGLDFVLRPGLQIAGRVEFYGGPQTLVRDMHVAIDASDGSVLDVEPAPVAPPGRFALQRLPAGHYLLRAGNIPPGWMVRSIAHEGRDVTAEPLSLSSNVEVVVTLTNRLTEVRGTVHTVAGAPDPDAAVIVFPADLNAWRGGHSGRVRSVRPDRHGEFRIVGLPSGDYLVATAPAEDVDEDFPSMFAELAADAAPVRVDEGQRQVVSLQTRARRRR